MTHDWFLGLLSGLLGAAFGVFLCMCWDFWKERRTTKVRTRALQQVVGTDLAVNFDRISHNLSALNQELSMLPQRKAVVEPLPLLRTGFWEILRLEPTSKFLTVDEKATLHNLFDLIERVNERLQSREQFKNNNGAMSTFSSTMTIHDEELIKAFNKLNEAMRALADAPNTEPLEKLAFYPLL